MSIGSLKSDLETPALLIDLNLMESNIRRMSDYFRSKNSKLRAHAKTHKSPIIAHKQIAAGANGVCCQKLGEAEVMVNDGISDVLITNEIVDPRKIERLASLNKHADVKVAIDDVRIAKITSDIAQHHNVEQGIVVEVDVRNKRCGTRPGRPTLDLVRQITKLQGLKFQGLMGYEGPFLDTQNFGQRKLGATELVAKLTETAEMIRKEGIGVDIVSAGSTGTFNITGDISGITEVEAGSYVFMDSTYRKLEGLAFECSLSVLATVISRPVSERVIVDAGWKSLTPELGAPEVKDIDAAKVTRMSEEHSVITVDSQNQLKVGDKIELIPSHCCTTVNLHDSYYCIRNEQVEVIWPILARGKSR